MFLSIKQRLFFLFFVAGIFSFSSCISSKKLIYLNDLTDSTAAAIKNSQTSFANLIQKNDQLSITVGGSNTADLLILNSAGGAIQGGGQVTAGSVFGYLVESDGSIKIPYVGKVQAAGLTRIELESFLTEQFKVYTKNPVVNVRFLNYSVSVLGEVNARGGHFSMTNERMTILEAIVMAGDISEFGRRDNIMVIREVNGERKIARVNLLSKDIFNSPYFYLKTNDVVYVEPVKARFISRSGIPQYLTIVAVGLSLLLTIINLRK